MRFVAKYKRYNITFQNELVEHFATGESRELKSYIDCQFDLYGSMLPYEIDAARKTFVNNGLPTEVDGVTIIDPLYRFSVFDTEIFQRQRGVSDEVRERMEQFLLARPELGTDFIRVEEPRFAPPWPTYDDFRGVRGLPTAAAIAKKVHEDGYEPAQVILYEKQNANRADVIEELEALGTAPAVPDDDLVSA